MPIKNSVSEIERLDKELDVKEKDILSIKEKMIKIEKDIVSLKLKIPIGE